MSSHSTKELDLLKKHLNFITNPNPQYPISVIERQSTTTPTQFHLIRIFLKQNQRKLKLQQFVNDSKKHLEKYVRLYFLAILLSKEQVANKKKQIEMKNEIVKLPVNGKKVAIGFSNSASQFRSLLKSFKGREVLTYLVMMYTQIVNLEKYLEECDFSWEGFLKSCFCEENEKHHVVQLDLNQKVNLEKFGKLRRQQINNVAEDYLKHKKMNLYSKEEVIMLIKKKELLYLQDKLHVWNTSFEESKVKAPKKVQPPTKLLDQRK